MLTEQELAYQIAMGNENVILDDDLISIDTPQIEMRSMLIHNALIDKLIVGTLQINEVDWSSFVESIFIMNHGFDFINRVKNKQLKTEIIHYWIDNYDEIIGIELEKPLWIIEWEGFISPKD